MFHIGAKNPKKIQNKKKLFSSENKAVFVSKDDGDGNWLVSYADLMTLLFSFFVIISSISIPDAKKYEELKQAAAEGMGGSYTQPFQELSKGVKNIFTDEQLITEAVVAENDEGVSITSKGTLFFDSGTAELKPQAQQLMEKLALVISERAQGFRVIVEGHTDDSPIIGSPLYPSNWELSSARAGTVVRLLEANGIKKEFLRPLGLSDTEPLLPNRTSTGEPIPANQAENRRIVIRLQKNFKKSPVGNEK